MGWPANPDKIWSEDGRTRPWPHGADICLACQRGSGVHRRLGERDESPASLIDLEHRPVLPGE